LKDRESFIDYGTILGMIGGSDDQKRRKSYERFVISGIAEDMNMSFWADVKGQAVLGSEGFTDWVYRNFLSEHSSDTRELPGIKQLTMGPTTVEEIAKAVASECGVPEAALYQSRAPCRDARMLFLELCRMYLSRKMTLAEIGKSTGGITASAFSRNRARLAEKLETDSSLRQRFEKLKGVGEV